MIDIKHVTQQNNCSICFDSLRSHESVTFPCGHAFGRSCFSQWADQCKSQNIIPKCCLCRSTVEEHLYRPKKTLLDRSVEQVKVFGYLGLSGVFSSLTVAWFQATPNIVVSILESFPALADELSIEPTSKDVILLTLLSIPCVLTTMALGTISVSALYKSGVIDLCVQSLNGWIDRLRAAV